MSTAISRDDVIRLRAERSLEARARDNLRANNRFRQMSGRETLPIPSPIGLLRNRDRDKVSRRLELVREAKRMKEAACGFPILTGRELRRVLPD